MDYIIYSVEDDQDIAKIINKTLSKQGYVVETFYDGTSFFKRFDEVTPHMVLLDMMLPDFSGAEIIKKIRNNPKYDDIDIIIISANRMIMDKVDGLDLGADDYIEKPFDLLELMSRVNAKFRKRKSKRLFNDDISLDLDKHLCLCHNVLIDLTVKEFAILKILLENKGKVVSRDEILEKLWGDIDGIQSRTVDMHIKSLRKKLKDETIIQTIFGIGYKVAG